MALGGRRDLPNTELEALLGLRYEVLRNAGRDCTYKDFRCEGSDDFEVVETMGNAAFIVRRRAGGDLFRVEIQEETNESGTSFYTIVRPWQGHEEGAVRELMESVPSGLGLAEWAISSCYRLYDAEPDAVLTLRATAPPEDDGALLLSFSSLSGAEVHSERVKPGEVVGDGLYRHLASLTCVLERSVKVATADGRMLARPAREGTRWSEWLEGHGGSGEEDMVHVVHDRAMAFLVKECSVIPAPSFQWDGLAVGAVLNVREACHQAGFFTGMREPPELMREVIAGLGGDSDVTVEGYYTSSTPGSHMFNGIAFGGAHKGKVLLELTMIEEVNIMALLKALLCTAH